MAESFPSFCYFKYCFLYVTFQFEQELEFMDTYGAQSKWCESLISSFTPCKMFGHRIANMSLPLGAKHDKFQAPSSCRLLISTGLALPPSLLLVPSETFYSHLSVADCMVFHLTALRDRLLQSQAAETDQKNSKTRSYALCSPSK